MTLPTTSVIVPTFNSASTITRTLSSLAAQYLKPTEVLIVDDGSTDATLSLVEPWGCRLPITTIELPKNTGSPGLVRNLGINSSSGDLVAFLDSDDCWMPQKLAIQVDALLAQKGVEAIHAPFLPTGPRFSLRRWALLPDRSAASITAESLLERNSIVCSSVLMSRQLLDGLGGFSIDPQLQGAEDYDLWLRVAETTLWSYVPKILGWYQLSPVSHSRYNSTAALYYMQTELGLCITRRPTRNRLFRGLRNFPTAARIICPDIPSLTASYRRDVLPFR